MHTSGEHDLAKLLKEMRPLVHPEIYAFCSFPSFVLLPALTPIATFRESEGLTAVIPSSQAQELGLDCQFVSRMITLSVHSALDAVGFLALITRALARRRIPCNVVSAYYHDHLFVPVGRLEATLQVLNGAIQAGEGP
jgi:hypothetical protein